MFDFLLTQNNIENPTELTVLITVLCSFFLSSMIVLTYELTTKGIDRPVHFLQAMVLISIVAATVMQAIGDSLARGLGMLGALAIIRFRTRLNDPRNIVFMFASITAGIACGVLGIKTAFIGTFGFCFAAILLRFSPYADASELIGTLKVRLPKDATYENELTKILKNNCSHFELQSVKLMTVNVKMKGDELNVETIKENTESSIEVNSPKQAKEKEQIKDLFYLIRMKRKKSMTDLSDQLAEIEEVRSVQIRFEKHKPEL